VIELQFALSVSEIEHFQLHSVMYICMLQLVPGPPFVFGAFLVICALLVAVFIPDGTALGTNLRTSSRRQSGKYLCLLL
jgi:hypothetical protein